MSSMDQQTVLPAIVSYMKLHHNIEMSYEVSYSTDVLKITLTKNGFVIRGALHKREVRDAVDPVKVVTDFIMIKMYKSLMRHISDTTGQSMEELVSMKTIATEDHAKILDLKKRADTIMREVKTIMYIDQNVILAGGCFTSWYFNQTPKDFDVFLLNTTEMRNSRNLGTSRSVKVTNSEYLNNPYITEVQLDPLTNIQYIWTTYKTRTELINHFDMQHCCVSYSAMEDKLYVSPLTLHCIKNRLVMPQGENKITQYRKEKMQKRGWREAVSV